MYKTSQEIQKRCPSPRFSLITCIKHIRVALWSNKESLYVILHPSMAVFNHLQLCNMYHTCCSCSFPVPWVREWIYSVTSAVHNQKISKSDFERKFIDSLHLPTDSSRVAECLCYCVRSALHRGRLLRYLCLGRAAGLGQPWEHQRG